MKLPNLKKTRNILIASILGAVSIFLVLAATQNNSSRRCKGLEVKIVDNSEQFLISKEDVEKWVTNFGNDPFEGKIIENICQENNKDAGTTDFLTGILTQHETNAWVLRRYLDN